MFKFCGEIILQLQKIKLQVFYGVENCIPCEWFSNKEGCQGKLCTGYTPVTPVLPRSVNWQKSPADSYFLEYCPVKSKHLLHHQQLMPLTALPRCSQVVIQLKNGTNSLIINYVTKLFWHENIYS